MLRPRFDPIRRTSLRLRCRRTVLGAGALIALALAGGRELGAQGVDYIVRQSASPCLNLRASPEASAGVLDCLAPGTRVAGIGTAPYWRQVRLADGRTGWGAKKFLELADAVAPDTLGPGVLERDDAWLEVHIVDVGQGDGIWIRTFDDGIAGNGRYEGRNIIIDGGPDRRDDRNALLQYIQEFAYEGAVIDALIISHPHNDHYPGALGILRHFEVRDYYDPGFPKSGDYEENFLPQVRAERIDGRPTTLHIGHAALGTPDWGNELEARFLYAWPGTNTGLGSRQNTIENNASIVLRIRYGDHSFLFMGDAEGKDRGDDPATAQYVEAILLRDHPASTLQSTVLKLGHHGSETSSTLPFIEAVDPRYVVASSGRRSYGGTYLPDRTTLARYCAHDPSIRIYRTDRDDAAEGRTQTTDADADHIVFRTNGRSMFVEAYSGGERITPSTCSPD